MNKWYGGWLIVALGLYAPAKAQVFKEWFRQKKTKIEYLVKQVAALQVYIECVQEGYRIADQGLQTIGALKNGDFNLHRDFFGSLKGINPRIKNYAKVADIIALQVRLLALQKKQQARIRHSDQLTEKEIAYLAGVYSRLLQQSADNVEELTELITANRYALSDTDRLKRIDALHADMTDKCAFADWFGSETDRLAVQRKKDAQETRIWRSLIENN